MLRAVHSMPLSWYTTPHFSAQRKNGYAAVYYTANYSSSFEGQQLKQYV